jgi:DNA ligase-1
MLAAASDEEDMTEIKFPVYASIKVDGIRCLIRKGKPFSRALKPIANAHINKTLADLDLPPFDGELKVGKKFQDSTSGIMSEDGLPDFAYWVFDLVPKDPSTPYLRRMKKLRKLSKQYPQLKFIFPTKINNLKDLRRFARQCVKDGHEGAIFRSGDSPYKYGRSTWKEGWCVKLKFFVDREAEICYFYEEYENRNKLERDALGYADRSSHQANMVGKGILGGVWVWDEKYGLFKIGTGRGWTKKLRKQMWEEGIQVYREQKIKYRFQPIGVKDKPRIPIALGIRHPDDL